VTERAIYQAIGRPRLKVVAVSPDHAPPSPSFLEVWAGLAAGDQDAARHLYERFIDHLVRSAAARLKYRFGSGADPESVAHSAFESFFEGVKADRYEFRNWAAVFGLLSHITFRKCLRRKRAETRQRRDPGAPVAPLGDWEAATAAPGPDEEAMVAELLQSALDGFDPDERAMLDAYLQGTTPDEVAQTVGLTVRTVQRVVARFRDRLESLLAND
jgi:RNA polymerase sigma-70 factor, ECF subfamily